MTDFYYVMQSPAKAVRDADWDAEDLRFSEGRSVMLSIGEHNRLE